MRGLGRCAVCQVPPWVAGLLQQAEDALPCISMLWASSVTFLLPSRRTLTHPAEICVSHHLRMLMANFIILERKCKWRQTAGAFLMARSDGGAQGLPHQRRLYPSAQTGPGGRKAGRLREQREQMAGKVGRWRSKRGWSRPEEEVVSVTCGLMQLYRTALHLSASPAFQGFLICWGCERRSLVRCCTASLNSGWFRVCSNYFEPARTTVCC